MLTEYQKKFCETYLANGFNAREAYYNSFPKADKTNKNPSYPYTLLKKPEIMEYIEKRRKEIYDSLNIDAIRVAQELGEIAFAAKGDTDYNTTAKLKALEILTKTLGMQTQKLETKNEVIEVSLED